MAAVTVIQY